MWLVPVLLVGTALRAIGLARGYWLDELANVGVLSRPDFAALFDVPITIARSPLFFWLYRPWLDLLGDGEVAARWFALVCGVLSIALIYRIGRDWFGFRAGLAAALLLAVNPLHIWYSGDASFYTLVTALALGVVWLFSRAFALPLPDGAAAPLRVTWAGIVAYGVGAGLLLASSLWGATLLVVQGALCAAAGRRYLGRFVAAMVVALLISAPASGLYVQGVIAGWSTPTTRSALPLAQAGYAALTLAWGFAAGPPPQALQQALASGGSALAVVLAQGPWFWLAAGGLLLVCGAAAPRALQSAARRGAADGSQRRAAWLAGREAYLALWLALPLVAVNLVTWWAQTNFNVRYVLFALPALVLWVARGRNLVIVAALGLAVLFLWRGMRDPLYAREDLRSPVRFLQAGAHTDDVVLLAAPEVYLAAPLAFYGPIPAPALVYHGAAAGKGPAATLSEALAHDRCRLWLWSARDWLVDPQHALAAALGRARATQDATWRWPGSELTLWRLPTCGRP